MLVLCRVTQLEDLAIKKWGSPEGFQKERDARAEKRLKNAASPRVPKGADILVCDP